MQGEYMNKMIMSVLLVLTLVSPVIGHGSEQEVQSSQGLSLPVLLGLTLVGAIVLLIVLYVIGVTDKRFLMKNLLLASILLFIDFLLATEFL
jgi:hypothetical protein